MVQFIASLAKIAGENGKVLAADVTDEYLTEFMERSDKYHINNRVTVTQADGARADAFMQIRLIRWLK